MGIETEQEVSGQGRGGLGGEWALSCRHPIIDCPEDLRGAEEGEARNLTAVEALRRGALTSAPESEMTCAFEAAAVRRSSCSACAICDVDLGLAADRGRGRRYFGQG
jgi:hypothetical protein